MREEEQWPGVKSSSSSQRHLPVPIFKMALQALHFAFHKTIDSISSVSSYTYL